MKVKIVTSSTMVELAYRLDEQFWVSMVKNSVNRIPLLSGVLPFES